MVHVVGFAPHTRDRAVLDLAAQLARSDGEELLVVTVVPQGWPTTVAGDSDREFRQWASAAGEEALAEARAVLAEDDEDVALSTRWVAGRSVPQVLMEVAEEVDAALIVVGSGSDGAYGHVVPSSTSVRLLHSSTVPVAIAPRGYRAPDHGRVARATCAFRGDRASYDTLARTARICARVQADLRVATFAVRRPRMYPPSVSGAEQMVHEGWLAQAEAAQREAIAELTSSGEAPAAITGQVAVGASWGHAIDDLDWGNDDVLVIGSSSSNAVASRLFLGSNAAKIVRHSPVPVIVVP